MLLCCMKTIKDVFNAFKQSLLNVYDAYETEALTLLVLNEITGSSKARLKAFPEEELLPGQAEKISNILVRLQTGEPVQYILRHTEFYGLTFKVSPAVLIPRPETEELVEWALASVGSLQQAVGSDKQLVVGSLQRAVGHILDIGTGSGCIAISLKKNLPEAQVMAIDISSDALVIAKQNADFNEVIISLNQTDILNTEKSVLENVNFDVIISNPPYVTQHDKTQMHHNVTGFEPHTALFVPEDDPLLFYKAIADFAIDKLTPNGLLFLEINENLGKETVELLESKSFKSIELRKDMSGRDRMIKAAR